MKKSSDSKMKKGMVDSGAMGKKMPVAIAIVSKKPKAKAMPKGKAKC